MKTLDILKGLAIQQKVSQGIVKVAIYNIKNSNQVLTTFMMNNHFAALKRHAEDCGWSNVEVSSFHDLETELENVYGLDVKDMSSKLKKILNKQGFNLS